LDKETKAYDLRHFDLTDTPPHIRKKQLEIHLAKSPGERFECALQMMEDGANLLKEQLRKKHPDWPEERIKKEFILIYYSDTLVPELLEMVRRS
jgi:hypothetical protein